ncbi:MAG: hypothetical protein QNJ51_30460 [Calothrix sp. MO_167.B12]|nr:hypothetical protein [Calothrix sp. MO_167.B12]
MKKTHAIAFSSVMAMSALVVTANPLNFKFSCQSIAEITGKSQKIMSVSAPGEVKLNVCPDYLCPWLSCCGHG